MTVVTTLILLSLIVIAGAVAWLVWRRRPVTRGVLLDDYVAQPLLGSAQLALYSRLFEALPDHLVFAQVSVPRFVKIVARGPAYWAARGRIGQLSVDFLICTQDGTPIVAIELDDKGPRSPERQRADAIKEAAFAAIGVRLVRWNVSDLPHGDSIRVKLFPPPPPPPAAASAGGDAAALIAPKRRR